MPPKAKTTKTVVTTTKTKSKARNQSAAKPRKRRGLRRRRKRGSAAGLVGQYSKCLSAPFIYPPVRAGYDTFVPTALTTAYLRGTITMSTGGNLFLAAIPNMANMLCYSSGATDSTSLQGSWTVSAAQNLTPIKNQFDMMRVIAGGIRVHPLVAATDKPGIMQSGLMPRCTTVEFLSFFPTATCNSVAGLPFLQTHAKTAVVDGIEVAWRPQDNADFEMHEFDTAWLAAPGGTLGNTATTIYDTQSPALICDLTGFPASSKVYVEVIFHYECTTSIGTISAAIEDASQQTMADQTSLPNFQAVFRSVANSLPPLTTVLTGLASFATAGVARAAGGDFRPNRNAVWLPD